MNTVIANEADLYFERGGPADRLLQKLGLVPRCLALAAITWLPMLVLSVMEGVALGPTPRESFLLAFSSYARCFVAIPLLLVAEVVVGPRLHRAAMVFVEAKLVQPHDYSAFERAIEHVKRWREAALPEIVMLAIALAGAWTLNVGSWYGGVSASWQTGHPMLKLWSHVVVIPIFQFLILRWLWRLLIWTRFLFAMSRLDLNIVGTHADRAGGLGFLASTHGSFGIFAAAISSVVSADAAFRIVYEGAKLRDFEITFAVLVILVELVFLGPLLVFMPLLVRKSREWRRKYSIFVTEYNRAFDEKWVIGPRPADEQLLGNADIQSLADLANNFDRVKLMRIIPFGQRAMTELVVASAVPALPLVPLVLPVREMIQALAKALF